MKAYIQYLEDVLGLSKIMIKEDSTTAADESFPVKTQFFRDSGEFNPAEKQFCELIFLNILTQAKESIFRSETNELFKKMQAAMKLKNLQVLVLDCTVEDRSLLPSALANICESKIVVVFSSFPKDIGELTYKGAGQWIETYSPAYLLEDPGAKKVVWNDLQKVMRELGL